MMGPATIYFARGGAPFQAEVAHLDSGAITATGRIGANGERCTRSWPMTEVKSVRWQDELRTEREAA